MSWFNPWQGQDLTFENWAVVFASFSVLMAGKSTPQHRASGSEHDLRERKEALILKAMLAGTIFTQLTFGTWLFIPLDLLTIKNFYLNFE